MRVGIFAKTFVRPTLAETLDAASANGLRCVQFNMACAGLPSMPPSLEAAQCATIRAELEARGIEMAAVSGTFNMIHPDLGQRRDGMRRLRTLAAACRSLGTSMITLCTGSRDPENMWRRHAENSSREAWADLVESMREAVAIAAEFNVTLGVEPEVSNVVDTAAAARRLLDELDSPNLKIIMDGANLFHAGDLARMDEVLDNAFGLLGKDIALAHAKDLSEDGEAGHEAAGTGRLDYDRYVSLLARAGYRGPLILHGLSESQVPAAVAFLRGKLAPFDGSATAETGE